MPCDSSANQIANSISGGDHYHAHLTDRGVGPVLDLSRVGPRLRGGRMPPRQAAVAAGVAAGAAAAEEVEDDDDPVGRFLKDFDIMHYGT
jgi:hypothetical protein